MMMGKRRILTAVSNQYKTQDEILKANNSFDQPEDIYANRVNLLSPLEDGGLMGI